MTVHHSEVVHTSVWASPSEVVAFLSDLTTWKTWAPWIRTVERTSTQEWTLETDAGRMTMRFVEPNDLGVLDHHVTLDSGFTVFNSMRVVANGSGSELVMILFQQPTASAAEFERDIESVRDDLARLKMAAEAKARR